MSTIPGMYNCFLGLKLHPDFKEKWCAALESGEYSQTRSVLKDDEGYCCLGVGCVITNLPIEDGQVLPDTVLVRAAWYEHIPTDTAHAAAYNPAVRYNGIATQLSELNDGVGLTFKEIAALIREQL